MIRLFMAVSKSPVYTVQIETLTMGHQRKGTYSILKDLIKNCHFEAVIPDGYKFIDSNPLTVDSFAAELDNLLITPISSINSEYKLISERPDSPLVADSFTSMSTQVEFERTFKLENYLRQSAGSLIVDLLHFCRRNGTSFFLNKSISIKDLLTTAGADSSPSPQNSRPRVNFDLDIYLMPLDGILSLVVVVTNTQSQVFFDYLTENGKHLDRTLSTVSHDMRAPLQAVVGYSEIVASKLKARC